MHKKQKGNDPDQTHGGSVSDDSADFSALPNEDLLPSSSEEQTALENILQIFIKSANIDFSHYRQTTVLRRISRRISLNNKNSYTGYFAFLRDNPEEIELLYDDLLLSHTEFFRDPQAFDELKKTVFPALMAKRPAKTPIRVWVAGCSTGEEVYSLAICLHEYLTESTSGATAQFFGTDLNLRHITTARKGIYPDKIRKTLSPERLARYFDQTPEGLMVTKQIREMCVFAVQDVTQDPPFPSIDLVSCRNVLIYFDATLQDIVIPLFHFALKPTGFLLLGTSESMGKFTDLFTPVNQNINLYSKRFTRSNPVYRFPVAQRFVRAQTGNAQQVERTSKQNGAGKDISSEIDTILLSSYTPPCIVVDGNMQIRQFRGDLSPYLTPAPGEASLKLSRMAREGFIPDIYVAVEEVKKKKEKVVKRNITFKHNEEISRVDLSVLPIVDPSTGESCFLVVFETPVAMNPAEGINLSITDDANTEISLLRNELQSVKEHLQTIVEEKDEVNQEMWAANEEIQSTNEELQSVNEEMEAAKEELESSNEELIALNEELQAKNIQLSESEEKFRNLVWDMQVGVLIQGPQAEILMANPMALELLGVSTNQLLGKTSFDPDWNVIHEDGSPFSGETHPVPQAIAMRLPVHAVVMGVYRPDTKDRVWLLVDAEPQLKNDGTVRQVVCTFVDISGRKKAEIALRVSEMKHRSMFHFSPMGIHQYELKEDGSLIFTGANPAADRILGIDHSPFIGKTIEDAFPALVDTEVPSWYREVVKTGTLWQTEQIEYANGAISGAYAVVAFKTGENTMVANFQDITARKKAEDELRESAAKFRSTFDQSPVGSVLVGLDKKFVRANPAFCAFLGYEENELIGKTIADVTFPEDIDIGMRELGQLAAGELEIATAQKRYLRKDGAVVWGELSISLVRDATGKPLYFLPIIKDVSDRKRAELLMYEQNELLSLFISKSPVYCYIKEVTQKYSRVLQASENFQEMIGIPGSKMVGKTMEDLYPLEFARKMTADDWEVVSNGKILKLDEDLNGRNYTTIKFPIRQGGKTLLAGYTIDITDRKKAEQDNLKYTQQLQQTQRLESLGVLAGGIAHDFNNLMGGIFGYIDLAIEEKSKPLSTSYLSKAMETIERARGLTSQLLTFAKGGAPVQRVTALFPFIQETAQFALSGSNVSCKFSIDDNLWPCNIDKNQIGQVIDNLVINAKQAMSGGGFIELTARNIVLDEADHLVLGKGTYVKLSIKDTGSGISSEIMPHIFDPFFTTKVKGHGLGLSTCYSIITRHGGYIDVESEPGAGTTFHVYLPAVNEADPENVSRIVIHSGTGMFIVMDDEDVVRETVCHMLESLGYSVIGCADGTKAIDCYIEATRMKKAIAGIILDLTVPGGMGGNAAIAEIRKLSAEVPVFVASGYAEDPVMTNPRDYGFTGSICKPFTKSDLARLLNKYVSV